MEASKITGGLVVQINDVLTRNRKEVSFDQLQTEMVAVLAVAATQYMVACGVQQDANLVARLVSRASEAMARCISEHSNRN